jgi:hypothetical protein
MLYSAPTTWFPSSSSLDMHYASHSEISARSFQCIMRPGQAVVQTSFHFSIFFDVVIHDVLERLGVLKCDRIDMISYGSRSNRSITPGRFFNPGRDFAKHNRHLAKVLV